MARLLVEYDNITLFIGCYQRRQVGSIDRSLVAKFDIARRVRW